MSNRSNKAFGIAQGWGTQAAQPGGGSTGPNDFTLSANTVVTAWGPVVVGNLVPAGGTPAGAYFVLADEPAGLAVVNG
jgi:hypothetical protein